jgi:oligoendopeptidase F
MKPAIVALLLVFAAVSPMGAADEAFTEKLMFDTRDEIPLEYRWNLEDIVPGPEAWDEARDQFETQLEDLRAFKGRLAESPEVLADALDLQFALGRLVTDIYVYAAQGQHTDTRDAEANERLSLARGIMASFGQNRSFIEPEIAQIADETLAEFVSHERLATYAHYLDNITRTKAHIRSGEVEEVLAGSALLQGAPSQVYQSMVSADIQWPEIEGEDGEPATVIPALFYAFMGSQDRDLRKRAALALFGTYDQFGHSLANTYAASVNKDVWLAACGATTRRWRRHCIRPMSRAWSPTRSSRRCTTTWTRSMPTSTSARK